MLDRIRDTITLLLGRWRWRKATTLHELANMQADRLARVLAKLADEDLGPEWQMYSTLVALGRAGVVVHDWRPGTSSYDGTKMETRACVTGFADDETKDWLDNELYLVSRGPGAVKYELTHVLELYAEGCPEWDQSGGDDSARNRGRAYVERIDGVSTARIGEQMDPDMVYRAFPTRADVEGELQEAWQITICAPTWGNSRMWADLLPLLIQNRRATVA